MSYIISFLKRILLIVVIVIIVVVIAGVVVLKVVVVTVTVTIRLYWHDIRFLHIAKARHFFLKFTIKLQNKIDLKYWL